MMNWFRRKPRKHDPPGLAVMRQLVRMLALTRTAEISCDEVYATLDQFAEAAHRGEDVLALMPLVGQHLEMCPDCREEYEALLRMLQPAAPGQGA